MFLKWSWIVPGLFLDCSLIVLGLLLDCSWLVPGLFLGCSWMNALGLFLDHVFVHLFECSCIFLDRSWIVLECFSIVLDCFRIVLGCSRLLASFAQPESASKSHVLSGSLLIRFTGYRLCRRPIWHSTNRCLDTVCIGFLGQLCWSNVQAGLPTYSMESYRRSAFLQRLRGEEEKGRHTVRVHAVSFLEGRRGVRGREHRVSALPENLQGL